MLNIYSSFIVSVDSYSSDAASAKICYRVPVIVQFCMRVLMVKTILRL